MEKEVICRDLENNKYTVPVSKLSFRPSVYGLIIEDNKILLSKQWDGYDLPGGGIELGETIEEALKREVFEETGLQVEVGNVITCKDSFFKLPVVEKYVHCVLMYFLCKRVGGELSTANFDENEKKYADMPEWVDISEIPNLKFYNPADNVAIVNKALELKSLNLTR